MLDKYYLTNINITDIGFDYNKKMKIDQKVLLIIGASSSTKSTIGIYLDQHNYTAYEC